MAAQAKRKSAALKVGDWVWVLGKVTRLQQGADGEIEHATVQLPNGNLATLRHNADAIMKAE
jgi:hypothetical protein